MSQERVIDIYNRTVIAQCNAIVKDYRSQGLTLTLRQLYYQLVAADIVPNTTQSYKRVGSVLSDGRLAGLVDWGAVEDRVRRAAVPYHSDEPLETLIEHVCNGYTLNRREEQPDYIELWCEKDALAGVLAPIADEFHCTLMVNRGYSSTSAMYESARRFKDAQDRGEQLFIAYIGDFDPSGEDMVRDVHDRLSIFEVEVNVEKIALTWEQIRRHRPPPNPAKLTDSRAAAYVAAHGNSSWEVDALPPRELQRIARAALDEHTEQHLVDAVIAKEEEAREKVRKRLKIGGRRGRS